MALRWSSDRAENASLTNDRMASKSMSSSIRS
jgi:hypothetical protein